MFRFSLVVLTTVAPLIAQSTTEPDVIVSDLFDAQVWGTASGSTAYSIGTTACNVGTTNLVWDPASSLHPVIAQNMYRLKQGRFEQIGMSWVTHCGAALNQGACGACTIPGSGSTLNIGCSDPSDAAFNGTQAVLGPRNEVNAMTGAFPYPVAGNYPSPGSVIDRRLQVLYSAIEPALNPGALYFVEAQYVHPDDAASAVANNNASYRAVSVSPGTLALSFLAPTQQMKPALQAWQDVDPLVQLVSVDAPGDGRFLVARKVMPTVKAKFHYEYAIQNLNSDLSMGSLMLEFAPGPMPLGISVKVPSHHSGEPYSNSPWTWSFNSGTGLLTVSTASYATNPNANALRWGSTLNLGFDCDQLAGNLTLGLFKPGGPATIAVPPFCPPQRPYAAYNLDKQATSPSDYVDISSTGAPGPIGNDNSFAVPIGFGFPFYGQLHTQVVISTNGYLTFPGQDGNVAANTTLPDPGPPNGMIAGYWDDLDCSNLGDIRYQTVATASVPMGLAVYWNCRHAGDAQPLKFELLLKPDGSIVSSVVQCPPFPFGAASATRGVEGPTAGLGHLFAFDTYDWAIEGQSIRYKPNWFSSNMLYQGRLSGGFVKLSYVSSPNTPILTLASAISSPLDLGILGVLPVNPFFALPISDHYGFMTGVPDPTAITDAACGAHELTVWIPPGVIPPGTAVEIAGLDFPASPSLPAVLNGWFNISNSVWLLY